MASKVRILSIDGGGIRGIIPAVILEEIEKRLTLKIEQLQKTNPVKKYPEPKIGNYFDLIAGTSTGGILSCIYLVPDDKNKLSAKFSATDALKLYANNGTKIFTLSFLKDIARIHVFFNEMYPVKNLEAELNAYFKKIKLSQLIKPCLITCYDIYERKGVFFNSADPKVDGDVRDYYLKDVARATSAAPTYFEPANIKSLLDAPFNLIDGGVFVNNPALCAYSEARGLNFSDAKILPGKYDDVKPLHPGAKDMLLISIGTGSVKKAYDFDKLKNAGLITWLPIIIDIMMSGNSETVHYHLDKIFDTLPAEDKKDYYRLEPSLVKASAEMDDATEENIIKLQEAGKIFITKNTKRLDEIVDKIIKYA
jgi:uncharacterized protein